MHDLNYKPDARYRSRDGFTGTIIGTYMTREGIPGFVIQQDATNVVHVYRVASVEEIVPGE